MRKMTKSRKQLSTLQAIIGILFSIVILVIAQLLAFSISEIPLRLGIPSSLCNIIAGILYVALTLFGVNILSNKVLKVSLLELRIPKFSLKGIWVIAAVLMPMIVLILSMITGGHWKINLFGTETTLEIITSAIVFYGLAAGVVEEVVFRGVIMGCLERRFHIWIAVIIPSILFGVVHIIGNELDFLSVIQLLIAGSIVGILFSLVAYESNSIWNNAMIHAVWNMVIIGGILHIGSEADGNSILNFVLKNKSFLISGGDFGIEASVISILAYLIFIILAIVLLKKKEN
mgnify:FL=1